MAPEPENRSFFQLVLGAIHSFSRDPQTLEIDTPYLNASIEGAEFVMRVGARDAALNVLEGSVAAKNSFGETCVASGDYVVARDGEAPKSVMLIRPRDAVQWGLHYPPVLADASDTAASPLLAESDALYKQGRVDAAIRRLEAGLTSAANQRRRAAPLLSVGRADEAAGVIDDIPAADPADADALALRAVLAVTQNRTDAALATAEVATTIAPSAAGPLIALSYAR